MTAETCDVLVVGGGIVGLNLALEARRRRPGARVVLLEKEDRLARHASGRNSGVLHAGFYYAADTLKARFTREGNRRMKAFCRERDLALNECGKLVVCRDADEHAGLDRLLVRGRANDVELEEIGPRETRELEPRARTVGRALWSPATASVDPVAVTRAFGRAAREAGVDVRTGVACRGRASDGSVLTEGDAGTGRIDPGYLVNAAGVHADRVARDFGFSRRYRILPFKGLYLRPPASAGTFRRHVYPVPDLSTTFLGVHVTVGVDGEATLGPTATPAFGREHYRGLEGLRPGETLRILARQADLFLRDAFGFRSLAVDELKKHLRPVLVRRAAELVDGLDPGGGWRWGRPGIRAQLVDVEEGELVMDFTLEGDDRSLHVLNAVSPGFTCAIPFREHAWDRIEEMRG